MTMNTTGYRYGLPSARNCSSSEIRVPHDGGQRGGSFIEVAVMLPIFLVLLLGIIDFARAYYLAIEVSNAARAGAQYGYQNSTTMKDTTGIRNAAGNDAPAAKSLPGWTVTSEWRCMCSDGTNLSSANSCTTRSCSGGTHQVNYLKVNTSVTYTLWFPLLGMLPASIPLSGQATMWAGE
jgi:Flp pilus assembly protein TadG